MAYFFKANSKVQITLGPLTKTQQDFSIGFWIIVKN